MTQDEARKLLSEYRVQIDEIDRQLVELLNRRTLIVEDIGRANTSAGMPHLRTEAQDDVYRNVLSQNGGPLTSDALRRIYERIIDEMRSLQKMRGGQHEAPPTWWGGPPGPRGSPGFASWTRSEGRRGRRLRPGGPPHHKGASPC